MRLRSKKADNDAGEQLTDAERLVWERQRAAASAAKRSKRGPAGPGGRGFRGAGGGAPISVDQPAMWRGTTVQACGLWPYAAGSGNPMVGVPLGRSLQGGGTVCCDPMSWFEQASLISNPSMFVLGQPGLGKSTVVRRMVTGLAGRGVLPMVFGDLKPDYVDLIEALYGPESVIRIGRGLGSLNVLDASAAHAAAERLSGEARVSLLTDARERRLMMVGALLTILRRQAPTDREESILDRALHVLDDRHEGTPVIADLLQVVHDAPEELRHIALDRGKMKRYRALTENLEASLMGLAGGRLGETFSKPTTHPMDPSRPVVYDVSSIDDGQTDLQAAALLACWSVGFGSINIAQALADAGLERQRHYFIVLDELWRALRAGQGMVDRVDALTRLNRQRGVGQAMVSHTMTDLLALPNEHDRAKARGFVERSGMVILGGLPNSEMPRLDEAVPLSRREAAMVTSWSSPAAWDSKLGREGAAPGRGKFLVKVGGRPGVPLEVLLTPEEKAVNNTNKRWNTNRADQAS